MSTWSWRQLELGLLLQAISVLTFQLPCILFAMQHPKSLALLGAVCSFTVAAAGSVPRGVGPECKFEPIHALLQLLAVTVTGPIESNC